MLYTVTFSPSTVKSGLRKCCNAAIKARHEVSRRLPSCASTCTSARIAKHLRPAIKHNDSVSRAEDRRTVFSRILDSSASEMVGLLKVNTNCLQIETRLTYRPTSKAGDAMGEISVEILKVPSNLRSGNGVVTSAEIHTDTLMEVSITSSHLMRL